MFKLSTQLSATSLVPPGILLLLLPHLLSITTTKSNSKIHNIITRILSFTTSHHLHDRIQKYAPQIYFAQAQSNQLKC